MMCQIAALLPPSHRGVYADHPRLRELLLERGSPFPEDRSLPAEWNKAQSQQSGAV
jgi:hypothetical protein